MLNDFILEKHFHLIRVTQLEASRSSSFSCRSAKFFASINSTGNGHFKKIVWKNIITSDKGSSSVDRTNQDAYNHDAYNSRGYNLRHEMFEITCLNELLMDVVDLKWEFIKFERIEFIGISLWLYNISRFQQN